MKHLKAIDLYSGIGGWHLGLKMANIDVVRSYEWWEDANLTHNINFSTKNSTIDIRKMAFSQLPLPESIDIVVGSPPCTQFSYANRGGSGNIADGLKDIIRFLEIIQYLKPKYWAMENIPRVAKIIKIELGSGGQLNRFKSLFNTIMIVSMDNYGIPQARKRMIAGYFPQSLLEAYAEEIPHLNLGDVINSLDGRIISDPLYKFQLSSNLLTDNEKETPLDPEEERMNRDSKTYHPIYNRVGFPDSLDKPSRTVTAVCTRVSRESIVIKDTRAPKTFRRLTARERACLQTFPITFQFYGRSYTSKLKMIGNAFPPVMAYYVAMSMRNKAPKNISIPSKINYKHTTPKMLPKKVQINVVNKSYRDTRNFRSAIPHLRFGSGVRFDLSNHFIENNNIFWKVSFYYGPSKSFKEISLNEQLYKETLEILPEPMQKHIIKYLNQKLNTILQLQSKQLQLIWCHKESGKSPFDVVDSLGEVAHELLSQTIPKYKGISKSVIHTYILDKVMFDGKLGKGSVKKIDKYYLEIYIGILLGAYFNRTFMISL